MFNKVELSVISSLNGAFTDDHRVDESRIKDDHGYVADYNGQQYQSEFIISLLTDSLRSDRVDPQTWNNNPEQWRYEIFALEEISQLIAENGYVDFNNLPISKEKGIDVNLLSCLSEVINYSTYIQDKLVDEMFKIEDETRREELEAAFPKANSFSLEVNQWNGEMASLYNVINGNTTYVINNKFMYDGLTFSESTPIDANLLRNVGENINQSTFLQYKLESTVEGLVPSEGDEYYVLDRTEYFEENFRNNDHEHVFDGVTDHNCTVAGCGYIKDYHLNRVVESGNVRYEFDMEIKYDDPYYHAWTVELKTIFGIVLDDENGMVSIDPTTGNEVVVLNKIKEQLHTLSINILTLASDMLDYYGHDEYHSSNIVRLNLIRPLEEFAYNTTDQAYLDAEAQMKYTSGLKWIDIPIDNAIPHNFTYDQNSDGSYSITNGALHRYDGENSFEIAGNKLIANFNGWSKAGKYIYELKNAVDDPNTVEDESNDAATLYLDEQNSNDNKKIYIKKGLDRDGNIHDLYKIEVNSDGTGIWYCINQRSDLHELETFFKLIGADDLGSAKSILSNTNIGDENNIINVLNDPEIKQQVLVLEDESYLIGKTFANRGISAYL